MGGAYAALGAVAARRPALLRYLGGKASMVDSILPHFPRHETYVEAFGGAGALLLAKPRSSVEVYNDLDGRLVALFRTLRRGGQMLEALVEAVALTPYAEAEFDEALASQHAALAADDEVEAARALLVRAWMSVGTSAINKASGFRRYSRADKRVAEEWRVGLPRRLRAAAERLQGVIVEGPADAIEVMRRHDGEHTLHYVDPPYVHSERGRNRYAHDMDTAAQERLLEALCGLRGAVVLSGYDNALYATALASWRRYAFAARADHGGAARAEAARTECLWLNAKAASERPSLFDDLPFPTAPLYPTPSPR